MKIDAIFVLFTMVFFSIFSLTANAEEKIDPALVPVVSDVSADVSQQETLSPADKNSATESSLSSAEKHTSTTSNLSLLSALKDSKHTPAAPVGEAAVGKMFVGLAGVLVIIFGASWLLKRFNLNKFGMASSMAVTGVLAIGAKEKVVVVDVEGTRLILGVTATSVTNLHTLTTQSKSPVELEENNLVEPGSTLNPQAKKTASFSEEMKKIMKEGLKSD